MKLERLHEYVMPASVLLAGMGFAYFCGHLTGEGQMGTLFTLLAVVLVMALLLIMKSRIWILIPMAWSLAGQVPILPLPFAVRDMVIMCVFGCFMLLKAFKINRLKPKTD